MITCHLAQDYDVLHTPSHQAATTMGPGMGLATPSSETMAFKRGLECDTPCEDRNRADCCRREASADSVEVSQGCVTKCPCYTASYKSANAMRMHLRCLHGDHRTVRSVKQAATAVDAIEKEHNGWWY